MTTLGARILAKEVSRFEERVTISGRSESAQINLLRAQEKAKLMQEAQELSALVELVKSRIEEAVTAGEEYIFAQVKESTPGFARAERFINGNDSNTRVDEAFRPIWDSLLLWARQQDLVLSFEQEFDQEWGFRVDVTPRT